MQLGMGDWLLQQSWTPREIGPLGSCVRGAGTVYGSDRDAESFLYCFVSFYCAFQGIWDDESSVTIYLEDVPLVILCIIIHTVQQLSDIL